MITWYTGQPGHGKSLHAIDHALRLADAGRLVYVCNVRDFNHGKAGVLPMTPEEFRDWPNFLPDGAVALVDEAYEHGMLPKRGPGTKVPHHVEQLAKHRHRGIDFIFVSQSPARQIDDFVHDLIEEHVHVRRRFGTPFVHLRKFDRFERNPLKAHPITLKRVRLPKRPMGLYVSTVLDTTEKKIPWYYFAAAALAIALPVGFLFVASDVKAKLSGDHTPPPTQAATDGAVAKAGAAPLTGGGKAELTTDEYIKRMIPRIAGAPWSAPLYDKGSPQAEPEIFCIASEPGVDAQGKAQGHSCSCVTEQGTDYQVNLALCRTIARSGPMYNPFKRTQRQERQPGREPGAGQRPAVDGRQAPAPAVVGIGEPRPVGRYGGMRSAEGNVASW